MRPPAIRLATALSAALICGPAAAQDPAGAWTMQDRVISTARCRSCQSAGRWPGCSVTGDLLQPRLLLQDATQPHQIAISAGKLDIDRVNYSDAAHKGITQSRQ